MSNFNRLYKKSSLMISLLLFTHSVLAQSLFDAAKSGKIESVEATLYQTYGEGINEVDQDGNSPLHHAVFSANPAVVDLLIAWGADVNLLNLDNESPLLMAARVASRARGDWSIEYGAIIDSLISANAALNTQDRQGNTALHYAAKTFSAEKLVISLVDAGADLNIQNNRGDTPLHVVSSSQNALTLLQAQGDTDQEAANLLIVNQNGDYTFFSMLTNLSNQEMVQLLTDLGFRPKNVNENSLLYRLALKIMPQFAKYCVYGPRELDFYNAFISFHDERAPEPQPEIVFERCGKDFGDDRNYFGRYSDKKSTPLTRALLLDRNRDEAQRLLNEGAELDYSHLPSIKALFGENSPEYEMARRHFMSRQKRA